MTRWRVHSIFNAPGGVGGKLGTRVGLEGVYGFDEAQGTNGHQIVRGIAGHGVFPGDVGHQAKVVLNEPAPGVLVPRPHSGQGLPFFLPGQGLGKAPPG